MLELHMCRQVGKDMEAQAFLGRMDSDPIIGAGPLLAL
jgi:hypothetical protein